MDWKELLAMAAASIGIDLLAFKTGLVGGFLSLSYEKKRTPWQAITGIISGAFLAGYLGPMAQEFFNLGDSGASGAAFLIGLLAMRIIPGLFGLAARFAKNPVEFVKQMKNGKSSEEKEK